MITIKNLYTEGDSNPGILFLWRMRCPLSHAARAEFSKIYMNKNCFRVNFAELNHGTVDVAACTLHWN
jgi:hypothetical protein